MKAVDKVINTTANFSSQISETSWPGILVASTMSPIIVLGTVGNVLSLLVWVKVRRCRDSTACFLATLAVVDLIALLLSGVNFWMSNVVQIDLRDTGSFACKFLIFVDFAAQFSSAWIIVLVTTERTFAVWFPHRHKKLRHPRVAHYVIIVTIFALLLICLPFLLSADISSEGYNDTLTKHACIFTYDSTLVKNEAAWFYVELLLHFVLPFVLIITSNSSILLKALFLAIKRKRSHGNPGQGKGHAREMQGNDRKMLRNVSVRIIVLSIAFCFGVGPIHLYGYKETLQVEQLFKTKANHTDSLYIPFVILMYLNNAINFFLYCFIGSGFRKDLVGLFRQRYDSCPVVAA